MAIGQTQRRTIHAAGNEDWAKIKITGNGAARLVVETAGAEGDTQLVLYAADRSGNQNGLRFGYDDDSGTGSFSRIVKTRVYPGIYYIRVLEFGNDWTIPAYTLKASWTPLAAPRADGYENDNLSTRAKEIRRNQTQRRSIHVRGDVDWVKFRVDGVGAMNFAAETHGVSGDTIMRLYEERAGGGVGARLAANDNGGAGSFSRIRGPLLLAGTYYLKIEERGNDRVIPGYMLTVNWTRMDAF